MVPEETRSFAALLRRYRGAAGLTQEALAERARISARAVSDLERGQDRAPRATTLQLLATALGLTAEQRRDFIAAAQRPDRRAVITSGPGAPPSEPGRAGGTTSAPAALPPLHSSPAPRHNLPEPLSTFIGREREQVEVRALLGTARLVTLTGAGGAGKTRLALHMARELTEYPDGVWLVELAHLAEATLVPDAVAQVLAVREEPGRLLLDTLVDRLRDRRLLLVLDNCEHLIAACAELASVLLRGCPHLRILATSREGLEIAGERRYRVPSLPIPDLAHLPPPDLLEAYPAVALFMARARERRPDFMLTAQNARAVAQVCARLDGVPLAIELAAARVGLLSVEAISARLDDRFRLLTGGARDALPRQRTLRATLDWSYDLLGESEQLLLDRLSVFAGGWTLAAAAAVCAGAGEGIEEGAAGDVRDMGVWEVLDLLGGLVNKSLAEAVEADGELRYSLLETVRQYGLERLAATGGAAALRDRHLSYFLALAEEAGPRLTGPEQASWLGRLEAEHDNLRAALRWARERRAGEQGLRLAGALWRFWLTRGYITEGRSWLEAALAYDGPGSAASRATALHGAGILAVQQGDYGRAQNLFLEALALRRALGDRQGIAASLSSLGDVAQHQGDYGQAAALYDEALALRRTLGDRYGIAASLNSLGNMVESQGDYARALTLFEESLALRRSLGGSQGIATALTNLGIVVYRQGDYARALALHEESLALFRALGDRQGIAGALSNLGDVTYRQGDYARALALHEASLARFRELGDRVGIAIALSNLGAVAYRQGDHERALTLYAESLHLSHDVGAKDMAADALECLAWVAAARGRPEQAARLGGAAEALREALGLPLSPDQRADHGDAAGAIRAALGEEAFAATWGMGRALSLEEAVVAALERGETDAPRSRQQDRC